jgi:plasmid stabilization system protein ParE
MGKKEKTTAEIRKIRVLEKAFQDIEEITDFIAIAKQQPLNAVKVAGAIFDMIDKVGQNPSAYKECEHIPTKTKIYRQAVCLSWLIIYKITNKEIIILGVIHSARHPSKIKVLRSRPALGF